MSKIKKIYIYLKIFYRIFFVRLALFLGFVAAYFIRYTYLKKIYFEFYNADVFLTGSAPTAHPPKFNYQKYVAVSSASKLLVDKFDKPCDLSIMDGSFFNAKFIEDCPSKSIIHQKKAYANNVKNLVVVSSNNILPTMSFDSLITSETNFFLPLWIRSYIVNYVCKTNYLDNLKPRGFTQVGTGVWSVALLVFLKVKAIHITGINFRTGTNTEITRYYHESNKGAPKIEYNKSRCRNHSSPDLNVLSALALRYREKITITTDENDLQCAISPNLS